MAFWSTVDCKADHADLEAQREWQQREWQQREWQQREWQQREWQRFYNEERTHASLNTRTPAARLTEVASLIPSKESVKAAFDPAKAGYVCNARYTWTKA